MNKKKAIQFLYGTFAGQSLLYGLPWGLCMFLLRGKYNLVTFLFYVPFGALFGIIMASVMKRQNTYFFKKAAEGKQAQTKMFTKLFRKSTIPADKSMHPEYAEYLDALKTSSGFSIKVYKITSIGIVAVCFAVVIFDGFGYALLGLLLFFALYSLMAYWNVRTLKKVGRLRDQLSAA